jgi:hypothetical protein
VRLQTLPSKNVRCIRFLAMILVLVPPAICNASGGVRPSYGHVSTPRIQSPRPSFGSYRSTKAPRVRGYFELRYRSSSYADIARDSRGRIKRSTAAKDEFKREKPCPATGRRSGSCPGYVIDHVVALKRHGADAPSNMQWQTIQAARAKDKIE